MCINARAVSFDFSTDGDFTSNFHSYNLDSATPGYEQTGSTGAVTWTSNSGAITGNFVYDTNGATAGGVANFIPGAGKSVTVSFDFSTSVASASVGVYFGGARGSDKLALFNVNNASSSGNDILRVFTNSNLTTSAATPSAGAVITSGITSSTSGATVSSGVVSLNSGYTINTTYRATFTLAYLTATTADATFTISDPTNALNPYSVTASGVSVSSSAGEIGFRTGFVGTGGTITLDNISITTSAIPEPSTFALLGGAGALGLALVSRRRRG